MAAKYWVDWTNESFPQIRDIKFSYGAEEGKNLADCKQEIYKRCDAQIQHWKIYKAETRSLRASDLLAG